MKSRWFVLVIVLALALMSFLPVIAQDKAVTVEYVFNGIELQKMENGVIVQTWTMPISLETEQILGVLQARANMNDPSIRYTFENNRMYLVRDDQIVGMWLLRGGRWIDEPALIVRYEYNGEVVRRLVNGSIQQTWAMPPGTQTYGFVTMMQDQANELVAAHVNEELHQLFVEHLPSLIAPDFTLHYAPADLAPDMTWYTPEFAASLTGVFAQDNTEPVVMAKENLVVVRQPAFTQIFSDPLKMFPEKPPVDRFDLYRFEDGKVAEMWLGFDAATLTNLPK